MENCCLFNNCYVNTCCEFFHRKCSAIYSFLTDEYDHVGRIESINPLCENIEDIPSQYIGYCYHEIKIIDGPTFKFINNKITSKTLNEKFKEDMMVKIVYKKQSGIIIKICPMIKILEKFTTLESLLHENDELLNDKIKVCYEDDKIKHIDFTKNDMIVIDL